MNISFYIGKKLISNKDNKKNVAATIIQIAQIAMALGIIVTLLTISIGIGFRNSIKERIAGFNGFATITNYIDNEKSFENTALPGVKQLISSLKNIPQENSFTTADFISHIQYSANKSGVMKTPNTYEGVIYKGFDTTMNTAVYQKYLIEGKIPAFGNLNNSIVISKKIAQNLQLSLHDSVYMYFFRDEKPVIRQFEVAGIYKTDIKDIDDNYILGDLEHIRRLNRWKNKEIGTLDLYFEDVNKTRENADIVNQNISNGYTCKNAFDTNARIVDWVDLLDNNIKVIIGIIFIVVSINMIMVLMILIIDRTPMIGTLKALGATNWLIRKIFLYHAISILSKGLFYGNIIAIGLILFQHFTGFIRLNPEFYYIETLPVYINIFYLFAINFFAILLSVLILIIPTYVIAKINPIKAIKFE